VAEVTSLGLVQMTRKRLGVGLAESMNETAADEPKSGETQGRRRRGVGAAQAPQRPATVTHAIPANARNVLTKIAGATIAAPRGEEVPLAHEEPLPPAATAPAAEREEELEQVAPPLLLDLPVEPKVAERPRRSVPDEAARVLDSVLDALPAPKRSGEGRRRSRRVSTPALTPPQDQ
jgi:ribonuclease E